MILSGATLKTALKRDNIIEGGVKYNSYMKIPKYSVEKCTKPGLYKLIPEAKITASVYGMFVELHPALAEFCEVSGQLFIPPDRLELPTLLVRPTIKDFDMESLAYIYRLFVIDGRIKK